MVHLVFYYLHLFVALLSVAGCPHKAQAEGLRNWILSWGPSVKWSSFMKRTLLDLFEVLVDTFYCNIGKIKMTDGEKIWTAAFSKRIVVICLYSVLEFPEGAC